MRSWAETNAPNVDIDRETARFLDRNRRDDNTYKDWQAAWRMWMTSPYAKNPRTRGDPAPPVMLSNGRTVSGSAARKAGLASGLRIGEQ